MQWSRPTSRHDIYHDTFVVKFKYQEPEGLLEALNRWTAWNPAAIWTKLAPERDRQKFQPSRIMMAEKRCSTIFYGMVRFFYYFWKSSTLGFCWRRMPKNIDIIEIPKKLVKLMLETYFKNGVFGHLEASNHFFLKKQTHFIFQKLHLFIPDFTRTLS